MKKTKAKYSEPDRISNKFLLLKYYDRLSKEQISLMRKDLKPKNIAISFDFSSSGAERTRVLIDFGRTYVTLHNDCFDQGKVHPKILRFRGGLSTCRNIIKVMAENLVNKDFNTSYYGEDFISLFKEFLDPIIERKSKDNTPSDDESNVSFDSSSSMDLTESIKSCSTSEEKNSYNPLESFKWPRKLNSKRYLAWQSHCTSLLNKSCYNEGEILWIFGKKEFATKDILMKHILNVLGTKCYYIEYDTYKNSMDHIYETNNAFIEGVLIIINLIETNSKEGFYDFVEGLKKRSLKLNIGSNISLSFDVNIGIVIFSDFEPDHNDGFFAKYLTNSLYEIPGDNITMQKKLKKIKEFDDEKYLIREEETIHNLVPKIDPMKSGIRKERSLRKVISNKDFPCKQLKEMSKRIALPCDNIDED